MAQACKAESLYEPLTLSVLVYVYRYKLKLWDTHRFPVPDHIPKTSRVGKTSWLAFCKWAELLWRWQWKASVVLLTVCACPNWVLHFPAEKWHFVADWNITPALISLQKSGCVSCKAGKQASPSCWISCGRLARSCSGMAPSQRASPWHSWALRVGN